MELWGGGGGIWKALAVRTAASQTDRKTTMLSSQVRLREFGPRVCRLASVRPCRQGNWCLLPAVRLVYVFRQSV